MSVTSATDSFTDGAELFDQEKYQSTVEASLEPDLIQMEQEFKRPLSQRITAIHSHTRNVYGEYRLDDVIVRCPSEAFREYQKQQWNTVKKEADEKSWRCGVTMIGAGVSAILGAVLTVNKAALMVYVSANIANCLGPIFCVAGAVVALASIVLMTSANSSYNQANNQINKWETDPVMKVGEARNEAYNQRFPYIYTNKLKLGHEPSTRALFHPLLVEYKYKKYFDSFCSNLLDQVNPSPVAWVNQFRSCNPVSRGYMAYGLGHIPEHMKPVTEDYSRFESFLNDIASSYDKIKSVVRKTANERIEAITKTRNAQLQPFAKERDAKIATAEANRDRVLRNAETSDTQRQEARATFTAIKETLQDNYNLRAASINQKYDAKIKEVESERDTQIKKLDEQKSNQLGNNYKAARELLVRAKEAWDNKGYQPVNFQLYFPYQPIWVNQQPTYYYQQPVYQTYPQDSYPGYGQFGYGHTAPSPAQQQYCYVGPIRG